MHRVTRSDLPAKLAEHIDSRCYEQHAVAFYELFARLKTKCGDLELREQKRYTAFYKHLSIFAYVEPQRDRIAFGLFANWVRPKARSLGALLHHFPEWNTSKGGLVGYSIQSLDPKALEEEMAVPL